MLDKYAKHEIEDKVKKIAERLEISDILSKYQHEISGGQKQRAAVARALVKNPKILLCDEPTGALDSLSSINLMEHLYEINKNMGTTIITVTHDINVASYSNRVVFLKDGKIIEDVCLNGFDANDSYKYISNILLSNKN